jgi:probable rRNA maturation factor
MTEPARPLPSCTIDVLVESPFWSDIADIESCVRRAVAAALPPDNADCELAVVLTDDRSMRALNARFRGSDTATNVLSFPTSAASRLSTDRRSGEPIPLGDIVIAFETAQTEAAAEGKEFSHHVTHLLVHGVLHLLGYDHHSDPEAEAMEARERAILLQLDMPDPYAEYDRVPADGHGCA